MADSGVSATATVAITAAPTLVTVSVSPVTASLQAGWTQQFIAAVTGTTNTAATWYVAGIQGGNSNVGTISFHGSLHRASMRAAKLSDNYRPKRLYDSSASVNATATLTGAEGAIVWSADHKTGHLTQWYSPSTGKFGDCGGGDYSDGLATIVASQDLRTWGCGA